MGVIIFFILITVILVWIGLGSICANMAEKRGRSRTFGFLGGLAFGFFCMIYYLIVGDTEEKAEEKETKRMQRMAEMMKAK